MAFWRRNKVDPRPESFRTLIGLLAELYAAAAALKPRWEADWDNRTNRELPPKYDLSDDLIRQAARDVRFVTQLLQANRWSSRSQPLALELDERATVHFKTVAAALSPQLVEAMDSLDGLREDERNWLMAAVEQLDDARRLALRQANLPDAPVGELQAIYGPLLVMSQLSNRLIERMQYDTETQ